jgi:YHS domain-containing protein
MAIRQLQARDGRATPDTQISDVNRMIQDPMCRVFVPKGTAVQEEIGGQVYFFCSRDCAKTFQKRLSG